MTSHRTCVDEAVDGRSRSEVGGPCHDGGELKVYKPEPTLPPATHAIFEDIEFDDELIAKMMANIAANGMTLADLGG